MVRGGLGVLACLPQGVSSSDKMILPRHPSSLDFSHLTGGRRPGSDFLPGAFTPAPGSAGSGGSGSSGGSGGSEGSGGSGGSRGSEGSGGSGGSDSGGEGGSRG